MKISCFSSHNELFSSSPISIQFVKYNIVEQDFKFSFDILSTPDTSGKRQPIIFCKPVNDGASFSISRLMEQQIPPMGNGKTLPAMAAGFQLAAGSQHEQPIVQREAIPVLDANRRFGRTGQKAGQYRRMFRIRTIEYQARPDGEQLPPGFRRKPFPARAEPHKLRLPCQKLAPLPFSPLRDAGTLL